MERHTRLNIWYVVVAAFGIMLLHSLWTQSQHVETISYSEFEQYLKDGRVDDLVITQDNIQGALKDSPPDQPKHIVANRVEPGLADRLQKYGVKFNSGR